MNRSIVYPGWLCSALLLLRCQSSTDDPSGRAYGGPESAVISSTPGDPGGSPVVIPAGLTEAGVDPADPPHAAVPTDLTTVDPNAVPPVPADVANRFSGGVDEARSPHLIYPNDGVMFPANLKRLEVHFEPGSSSNAYFRIAFDGPRSHVVIYTRCTTQVGSGCVYELDPATYASVVEPNRAAGPIALQISGAGEASTSFGKSQSIQLSFSEEYVLGGIYYWTTSLDSAIMRYDFGGTQAAPEVFMSPKASELPRCVGCHALSRDGSRMVASLGGMNDGALVYVADLTQRVLTREDDKENREQFASFNPTGDRFVSVYGDTDNVTERNTLWFSDGVTGKRIAGESVQLPFEPDHPDWSPDGSKIALTHVGSHGTSQTPHSSGIDVLPAAGAGWGSPFNVVPAASGINRFSPTFAPDSSFLLFTQANCPGGNGNDDDCNGDSDSSAKIWAVAPRAGATPVALDHLAKPGVADGTSKDLTDTFARFAPSVQTRPTKLMWATISSRRKPGLRPLGTSQRNLPDQLLWMVAIDPEKIAAGQDGSYAAFYLPFQDLTTSNHLAQWTRAIVGKPQVTDVR